MKILLASLLMFFSGVTAAVTLEVLGGDGQTAVTGTLFAQTIRVRALNDDGTPVRSAAIEFEAMEGGPYVDWYDDNFLSSTSWITGGAGGLAESPVFRAEGGVGPGVIEVRLYDGFTGESAVAYVKFTATYADGSIVKSFQDLWWGGAAENGWGVMVAQQDTRLFNVVYAYDAAGEPTWFVASQGFWGQGFGSSYHGDVHAPTSAPYFAYDARRFDPGPARAYYSLYFDRPIGNRLYIGAMPANAMNHTYKTLQRFEFAAGAAAPLQGVAGLWWGGAAQNGWGISIAERPGALFIVWFTYGADGKPIWFSMPDARASGASTWTGTVFRTSSSSWVGVGYDASRFQATGVGTFELRFDGTRAASFTFDVEGHRGVLALERFGF